MKKISGYTAISLLLILVLLVIFIVAPVLNAMGDIKVNRGDRNRVNFGVIIKAFTSAQSRYELLAAPSAGKIVVDQIVFSTDTSGYVYLSEKITASHLFGSIYMYENNSFPSGPVNVLFSDGEGVDVTSNISGNHTVRLEYHTE